MATETKTTGISPKLLAELQETVDNAVKGIRDPEMEKKACRDMDRMRKELGKKVGILDVAVELVRDARNGCYFRTATKPACSK